MLKRIKNFGKDKLVRGSFVLFAMMNIFNFFNYIFHFSMARLLGAADYGILAVLMSIVYIFAIPSESVQTIISGYTSKFNIKKEYGKIKDLLFKSLKKGLVFSVLAFILFIPIALFLSGFLNIRFYLLILTGLLIFYSLLFPILRGILQGRKKFKELGFNMDLESVFKLAIAILLVYYGFGIYGAMAAVIIAGIAAFFLAFLHIKEIIKSKREKGDFREIYLHSLPVFISIIAIVLIYSLDIIIAKRFFSPEIAGKYAVVSMLGKIIVFGTSSIGKAMFPFSSESYENGKETRTIFKKSMKIAIALIASALLIYLLFPKLVIGILFGAGYSSAYNILFITGLSFSFISVANIIILYKLSTKKLGKSSFGLLGFAALQIIALSIFNSSLMEFALAFLGVTFLMLVYSLFLIRE